MFRSRDSRVLRGRVLRSIRAQELIREGEVVVVAVSGGLDSSCLLALLREIETELPHKRIVAHVNHGLRGADSDADERFVEGIARAGGDDFRSLRVRPEDWPRGESRQAAARAIRLAFFRLVARETGGTRIALGHTEDDAVETVLMRLIEGCSPGGAAGIRALEGDLVRPLLSTKREALERLSAAEEIGFREDRTNRETAYARNRVRARILPAIEAAYPGVRGALLRFSRAAARDEEVLRAAARELRPRAERPGADPDSRRFDVAPLARAEDALVTRILFRAIEEAGKGRARPTAAHVESVLAFVRGRREGGSVSLPAGLRATCREGVLEIGRAGPGEEEPTPFSVELPVPGAVSIPGLGLEARASIGPALPPGRWVASFLRAAGGTGGLVVRSLRPGDRLRPEGMAGRSRKIADLLADRKVPRAARSRVPLLVAGGGTGPILWVVGHRVAEGVRAPAGDPDAVLVRFSGAATEEGQPPAAPGGSSAR